MLKIAGHLTLNEVIGLTTPIVGQIAGVLITIENETDLVEKGMRLISYISDRVKE